MRKHLLSDVNEANRTAVCAECGPVKLKRKGLYASGKIRWACRTIHNQRKNEARRGKRAPYRVHLRDQCERCGFRGHPCQLDVHHIDRNHGNNDPTNLMTLCANCHRLEHHG